MGHIVTRDPPNNKRWAAGICVAQLCEVARWLVVLRRARLAGGASIDSFCGHGGFAHTRTMSTSPAVLRDHSWHPVPLVIAADSCRTDAVQRFSETECLRGGLGRFPAKYLIPVALAHARRLQKFGA